MANITKWSNVQVSVESALATAVVLTSISKANPPVVAWSTGTDPANGDYVSMAVNGMRELDSTVQRIANVNGAGNTAELEGQNSTLYNTFTSGSLSVITFGTSIGTIRTISVSGGDYSFIDTTTIHDGQKRQIPDLPSPSVFTLGNLWDPADAGLAALRQASINQAKRAIRFTFQNGYKMVFVGYIGASLVATGTQGGLVETPVTITADGPATFFTT